MVHDKFMLRVRAYQLVTADHSHDGKRLNAVIARVESTVARTAALVTKDNVRVDVSIQVTNTLAVATDDVLERSLRLSIARATAAAVVSLAALNAVAVNVHVDKFAIGSLEVDDVVVVLVVAAVGES